MRKMLITLALVAAPVLAAAQATQQPDTSKPKAAAQTPDTSKAKPKAAPATTDTTKKPN